MPFSSSMRAAKFIIPQSLFTVNNCRKELHQDVTGFLEASLTINDCDC